MPIAPIATRIASEATPITSCRMSAQSNVAIISGGQWVLDPFTKSVCELAHPSPWWGEFRLSANRFLSRQALLARTAEGPCITYYVRLVPGVSSENSRTPQNTTIGPLFSDQ